MRDLKHYRAKQLIKQVEAKPDLFPIWEVGDHSYNGIMFRCLIWKGPGRRVVWTPHALERLLERRNLNYEDDNSLANFQNQTKGITAQPWLHTFGVGEHAITLRSSLGTYTIAFIVEQGGSDVVVKTYIDNAKASASHEFKSVQNSGVRMQRPEEGRHIADQEFWSEERREVWNDLWDNIPKVFDKVGIRRWLSEIAITAGDVEMAEAALNYIITGYHHETLLSRVREGFAEDTAAGASWSVSVARYIEAIHYKEKNTARTLALETLKGFLALPAEKRALYAETYARFQRKVPMAMPAFTTACDPEYVLPGEMGCFSEKTMIFREILKRWSTRNITHRLGVPRSCVNDWYWHADEIPPEFWEILITEPSPERDRDASAPVES